MFHGTREHDLPLIHRIDVGAAELGRRARRQGSTGGEVLTLTASWLTRR